MARGYCYFLTNDHTVNGDFFDEDFLFEAAKDELRGAATYNVEGDELEGAISIILSIFKKYGAAVGSDTVTFGNDFRSNYFASRFDRFQKLAANMTLEDFAEDRPVVQEDTKLSVSPILEATCLLNNEYGDHVWLDDTFLPMDEFIRQYAHGNNTFFVRRAVYLK